MAKPAALGAAGSSARFNNFEQARSSSPWDGQEEQVLAHLG